MQAVLEPVLRIRAPPADDVARLRPKVLRARGRAADLEAHEVVFLVVAQTPVRIPVAADLAPLQTLCVLSRRPDRLRVPASADRRVDVRLRDSGVRSSRRQMRIGPRLLQWKYGAVAPLGTLDSAEIAMRARDRHRGGRNRHDGEKREAYDRPVQAGRRFACYRAQRDVI